MDRWASDHGRCERLPSWVGLLSRSSCRWFRILVSRAKIGGNAGMLHPDADKFGDVLVSLLFESGNQIADVKAAAAARVEHVGDRGTKDWLTVAVFEAVKKEKALGTESSGIFRSVRGGRSE